MSGVKLSLLGKDTQELPKPRNVRAIDISKITEKYALLINLHWVVDSLYYSSLMVR